jgi:hypothetical protein
MGPHPHHFSIVVDIDASADRVWSVIRDIEHWPEWTPTVMSVRLLEDGPLAVGSRAFIRQPKLAPAKWRVTELDDVSRGFTWITRGPGILVTARHWVEPSGNGSRATLSIQFSGLLAPLVARFTRKLNERYLALEANGLRARSEE